MMLLTPQQLEELARSIALHSSGATGGTGHISDFNANSIENIVSRVKDILQDPNTKFMINSSNDPERGGAVIFFNEKTKSFLIFNPNQLNDPKYDESGKIISGRKDPDNLAGTFYREPKLNEDGIPFEIKKGKTKTLTPETEQSRFEKQIRALRNKIAAALVGEGKDVTPKDVEINTISQNDEWVKRISHNETKISEGRIKAQARVESGEYSEELIIDKKPNDDAPTKAPGNAQKKTGTSPTETITSNGNNDASGGQQTGTDGGDGPSSGADDADKPTQSSRNTTIKAEFNNQSGSTQPKQQVGHAQVAEVDIDRSGSAAPKIDPPLENQPHPSEVKVPKDTSPAPMVEKVGDVRPAANEPLPPPDNVTPINKNKAPDEVTDIGNGKTLSKMDDVADALKAARAAKMAKLGIVTGVAVTVGIDRLLHYAHGKQREAAGELAQQGKLSPEALKEYLELNKDVETMMRAENVGGQGLLFLVTTPAVERKAQMMFEAFSAKHGLDGPTHKMLGMSMFDNEGLRGAFAKETREALPNKQEDVPPDLMKLWEAEKALEQAEKAHKRAHNSAGRQKQGLSAEERAERAARKEARQDAADNKLFKAESKYSEELAKVMSDPESAKLVLDKLSIDMRIDLLSKTARYNAEGQNPLIQRMAEIQEKLASTPTTRRNAKARRALRNELSDIKEELKEKPEIVNDYTRKVFGGGKTEKAPEKTKQAEIPKGPFDGVAGDKEVIADASKAGVNVAPEAQPKDNAPQQPPPSTEPVQQAPSA